MTSPTWISSTAFADAEAISVQAARTVLRVAYAGKAWRGRKLDVRIAPGAGGRRGLRYEVKVEAPEAASVTPPDLSAQPDNHTLTRAAAIREILVETPDPASRGALVTRTALAAGVSRRTVYRWIARHEDQGLRGLGRRRPSNAGRTRISVSRAFDAAYREAGHSDAVLRALAEDLQRGLRGLWASRAEQAGGSEIRKLAEHLLFELCQARGLALPEAACRLSRRYVERFAAYRVVNQRRNDRKAFDDGKPRIRRDWTGLLPMERVVADVKHLDVIVRRPDGSPAWPKIIAFMDAGTGRVFVHPVLLERGEGVRQEHVIEAFIAMACAPNWGFPQGLYLDNGTEFAALSKLDGALQLVNAPGARTLIFARPYNAAAKPIESLFARLDRQVFCLLPGYAGPNRMAKKTQTVGKAPLPYPGDFDDFTRTVQGLITAHNHRQVGGARQGRSPADWLQRRISEGWRPVSVDALELDAAFADPDSRRVDRGVVKINGRRYTHEQLAALPSRTVVDLALTWRRDAAPLAKLDGRWVYLQAETLFPARWIEGAKVSDARQVRQKRFVAKLASEAPPIDPVALKVRWGERQTPADTAWLEASLDLGGEVRDRAEHDRAERAKADGPTPAELRRAREMALTERLEEAQNRHD